MVSRRTYFSEAVLVTYTVINQWYSRAWRIKVTCLFLWTLFKYGCICWTLIHHIEWFWCFITDISLKRINLTCFEKCLKWNMIWHKHHIFKSLPLRNIYNSHFTCIRIIYVKKFDYCLLIVILFKDDGCSPFEQ